MKSLEISIDLKNFHFDSVDKKLNDFRKRFNRLKTVKPQTDENKNLQEKVLDDVGDLFNELYYIYKDKYSEEKDGLNARNKKKIDYKKVRLTDDYRYESEEKEQQTSKKPDKKELRKKSAKDNLRKFNEWVNKKGRGLRRKLFKRRFNIQRPSDMLKVLYTTNDKKKNNDLVIVI